MSVLIHAFYQSKKSPRDRKTFSSMTLQMWLKNFLKKTKIAIAFEFYFCFIKVNGA